MAEIEYLFSRSLLSEKLIAKVADSEVMQFDLLEARSNLKEFRERCHSLPLERLLSAFGMSTSKEQLTTIAKVANRLAAHQPNWFPPELQSAREMLFASINDATDLSEAALLASQIEGRSDYKAIGDQELNLEEVQLRLANEVLGKLNDGTWPKGWRYTSLVDRIEKREAEEAAMVAGQIANDRADRIWQAQQKKR